MNLSQQQIDDLVAKGAVLGPTAKIPEPQQGTPRGSACEAGVGKPRMSGQLAFTAACASQGLPCPEFEYRFDSQRRWRFDMAWPSQKLAVEVQGGLFCEGRHTRGTALLREYEKLNAAVLCRWRVLLVTPEQVEDGSAIVLIRAALEYP